MSATIGNGSSEVPFTESQIASAGDLRYLQLVNAIFSPQGRLTLQSGAPVMATSQAAKTTIYYTPYVGNLIPVNNGSILVPTIFAELSVAISDTSKNPAAIGASKVNDWFVWNDAGTLRLSHGPDWTNDTTRSAGTALVRTNGILTNAVAITNGPGVSLGTYVGTTRSDAASQLNWVFGSAAGGGGLASLYVWNMYNRIDVSTTVVDTIATWSYTSTTVRPSENSASNRISFVAGLAEEGISAVFSQRLATAGVNGAIGRIGIGIDVTNAYTFSALGSCSAASVAFNGTLTTQGSFSPQLGAHFLQALENGDGSNAITYVGGSAEYQFSARLRM